MAPNLPELLALRAAGRVPAHVSLEHTFVHTTHTGLINPPTSTTKQSFLGHLPARHAGRVGEVGEEDSGGLHRAAVTEKSI